MLIPLFYLGYHKIPYSWAIWIVLAGIYYWALYAYISKSRQKAREASGEIHMTLGR